MTDRDPTVARLAGLQLAFLEVGAGVPSREQAKDFPPAVAEALRAWWDATDAVRQAMADELDRFESFGD